MSNGQNSLWNSMKPEIGKKIVAVFFGCLFIFFVVVSIVIISLIADLRPNFADGMKIKLLGIEIPLEPVSQPTQTQSTPKVAATAVNTQASELPPATVALSTRPLDPTGTDPTVPTLLPNPHVSCLNLLLLDETGGAKFTEKCLEGDDDRLHITNAQLGELANLIGQPIFPDIKDYQCEWVLIGISDALGNDLPNKNESIGESCRFSIVIPEGASRIDLSLIILNARDATPVLFHIEIGD